MSIANFRYDFEMLSEEDGQPLIYLDNGATSLKPKPVIDLMETFYRETYATIHRGIYKLSQKATFRYDAARETARQFLNAASKDEIIFVRGTTEAINLVAASYGALLPAGSEIIISESEHHANIVPWQMLAKTRNLVLKVVPITDTAELDMDAFDMILSEKTALVAIAHIANSTGTIHPVSEIIKKAHHVGAKVLIDGAQSAPHEKIDVQALDCDFYCFSSHKTFGPTGVGVLYGKLDLLDKMPPYQTGGDMIDLVTFEKTTFLEPPHRFEAGTPAIVETLGMAEALTYLSNIGWDLIHNQESDLLNYATQKLSAIPNIKLIGTAKNKASLVSFIVDGCHSQDVGTILDSMNICVRVGHHCAQPVMRRFSVDSTIRASFAFYNTRSDVDALVLGLEKAIKMLS